MQTPVPAPPASYDGSVGNPLRVLSKRIITVRLRAYMDPTHPYVIEPAGLDQRRVAIEANTVELRSSAAAGNASQQGASSRVLEDDGQYSCSCSLRTETNLTLLMKRSILLAKQSYNFEAELGRSTHTICSAFLAASARHPARSALSDEAFPCKPRANTPCPIAASRKIWNAFMKFQVESGTGSAILISCSYRALYSASDGIAGEISEIARPVPSEPAAALGAYHAIIW